MKHFKTNKLADSEMYDKLDYHDYSEFDDDYYYDLVEERSNSRSNRKRSRRKSLRFTHTFEE